MTRSARIGALLYTLYPMLIVVEVLWVVLGPRWFRGARFWAEIHPPHVVVQMILGFTLWFAVAWGLRQGHRWAWFASVAMSGRLSGGGALMLLVVLLLIPDDVRALASAHPVEAAIVLMSMAILAMSVFYLCRQESRDWFLRRRTP